jgi:hypothetical protein
MNTQTRPICYVAECVSCVDGCCISLTNNNFGEGKCPFFKTSEQVLNEKAYCEQRLRDIRIGNKEDKLC